MCFAGEANDGLRSFKVIIVAAAWHAANTSCFRLFALSSLEREMRFVTFQVANFRLQTTVARYSYAHISLILARILIFSLLAHILGISMYVASRSAAVVSSYSDRISFTSCFWGLSTLRQASYCIYRIGKRKLRNQRVYSSWEEALR